MLAVTGHGLGARADTPQADGTIDYGDGVPVSTVSIIETGADGKVVHQTDYFANPFVAPAWRAQWVERMEPMKVG